MDNCISTLVLKKSDMGNNFFIPFPRPIFPHHSRRLMISCTVWSHLPNQKVGILRKALCFLIIALRFFHFSSQFYHLEFIPKQCVALFCFDLNFIKLVFHNSLSSFKMLYADKNGVQFFIFTAAQYSVAGKYLIQLPSLLFICICVVSGLLVLNSDILSHLLVFSSVHWLQSCLTLLSPIDLLVYTCHECVQRSKAGRLKGV